MKLRRALTPLLFIISFFCYSNSYAWGLTGHRIVAEIADYHLTNKARKNIKKILRNESLAMAANWPDFIKSDPTYSYLSSWHYVNFKSGLSSEELNSQLKQDTTANASNKLAMLIEKLGTSSSALNQETKLLYLRLLIHIVGDIHQPMHTGRLEDLGGNKIKLYWFNESTNLHRLWDEQLIDFQQLSYTEYTKAINIADKHQRDEWQQTRLDEWLYESYQIAELLYSEVQADDKLSYRYNFDHLATLNRQLLKGGLRLAALLNNLFG